MENLKHTPAPWQLNDNKTTVQKNDEKLIIANCNSEHNAKLIASAPELLEALELVLFCAEKLANGSVPNTYEAIINQAKTVIKKATE